MVAVLVAWIVAAPIDRSAHALTADEYRSLRTIWKLGYVVGIAHGRALYRAQDTDANEVSMDACIPAMSDVRIVEIVDAYLAANPELSGRPAADIVIEAVSRHCAAK